MQQTLDGIESCRRLSRELLYYLDNPDPESAALDWKILWGSRENPFSAYIKLAQLEMKWHAQLRSLLREQQENAPDTDLSEELSETDWRMVRELVRAHDDLTLAENDYSTTLPVQTSEEPCVTMEPDIPAIVARVNTISLSGVGYAHAENITFNPQTGDITCPLDGLASLGDTFRGRVVGDQLIGDIVNEENEETCHITLSLTKARDNVDTHGSGMLPCGTFEIKEGLRLPTDQPGAPAARSGICALGLKRLPEAARATSPPVPGR